MPPSKVIGAIEIGTTSVKVLIGEVVCRRSLNIIGMAQSSSNGIKKGEILDFRAASNATHAAIISAEKSAGQQIDTAYLSLSGSHLDGFFKLGAANVSGADNVVRQSDIERAFRDGKSKELPSGRVYIHHIRNQFLLDDRIVTNPLGMDGSRIQAGYWSVHADERKVRDLIHVVNGFGLNVEDVIVSSVASAAMVSTEAMKRGGVLVVDMGGGTTDWVLYESGSVVRTGVVPVGGDHLRNDLAMGLRVNARHAAKLLNEFGRSTIDKDERGEKVWMVGDQMIGDRRLPLESLVKILNARIDEIFQIIRKQLGNTCNRETIPSGAVLTGGVANLPRVAETAAQALGLPTTVGKLPNWVREDLNEPAFATPLGLLHFALMGRREDDGSTDARTSNLLHKVAKIFVG